MLLKRVTSALSLVTVGALLLTACGTDTATATVVPAATDTVAPAMVATATVAPAMAATATVAPAMVATATVAPAMAATDTVAPAMAATATTGGTTTGTVPAGKIAILLPETKTARYESQDLPLFKAKLAALGFDVDKNLIYSNANQDASAQQQQAEAALTNGAKVLVLDPVDSAAAGAIADAAKAKGVPVISYDRLIKGSDAVNYYISFDNEQVGKLQGQSLLDALKGKTNPTVVMINGSPTDNNATLFKKGAHSVLDGKVNIAKEYDTPDWSPDKAQGEMQQALTALGNKVDGVLAANDGTGGGAIAAMKAAGVNPLPPVTGQDAELAAIQRILIGEQYMTIYKAIKPEAEQAAELAFTLLSGKTPDASMAADKVANGKMDVPSILLNPVVVTKANVNDTVIKDGFWKASEICTSEYAKACTDAGVMAGGSTGGTMTGAVPAGKIALLLPETKTARYESQDLPLFKAKLAALGFDVDKNLIYSNANQDASAQQQQAEAALTNGAKVLVLDPVDSAAAASIADAAKAKGVPVISYDRLIKGSDAVSYYISFDNEQVGKLQGQSLLDALKGKTNPTVVMINGSPTDNNATLFKKGAHSILDGKVNIAKEYDTPDWSPDKAQGEMQQALTALGNKVDGVLAANDGTGGGAIAAMKAAGVSPLPPVTGQDAELAAIQRILVGEQYMTIYKAIKPEAEQAAQLAFTLLGGKTPDAGMVSSKVANGKMDVPSILLNPVAVTKANVNDTVVKDGFWKASDICTSEYAQACTAAGIK